jgi:hypothetical protein
LDSIPILKLIITVIRLKPKLLNKVRMEFN